MEVEVLDSDVVGVEFRQIGYILRCSLSHAITLVSNQHLVCVVAAGGTPEIILIPTVFVFLHRSSSKMAANLRMSACTTSLRESTASASPSQVRLTLLTSY